jgi:signal transduction histidine kinase/HAMP domain-containing protein
MFLNQPGRTQTMSIRQAMVLLTAVVLIPPLVVQGFIFYKWYDTRLALELNANLELARSVASNISEYIQDIHRQEEALGTALALLEGYSKEQSNLLLKTIDERSESVGFIHWTDPNGVIIASSVPSAAGIDIRDESCVQAILTAKKHWAVTDLLISRANRQLTFLVATGIREQGVLKGVIVGSADPTGLKQALGLKRAARGIITAYDTKGALVFRLPNIPLRLEPLTPQDPLLARALAGEEAVGSTTSQADRKPLIAARVPIPELGWVAGAARPREEVIAPLIKPLLLTLGVILLVVVSSSSIGLLISRKVIRDVRSLEEHAAALGRGNLDHQVNVTGISELQRLAEAYNEMAARRQHAEKEIRLVAKFPAENPNPILRIGNDRKLVYSNSAAGRLLEVWKCGIGQALPDEIQKHVEAVLVSGKNEEFELAVGNRTFSMTFVPILEAGYVNIYGRDVTERTRAEDALRQTADALARSNKDLEQFAYVASHDLQEPLRMVSGFLQLLERRYKNKLDSNADEFIQFAVDGTIRMQQLISDLLSYSRVGTKGRPMEPTDCNEVLAGALANLRPSIEKSGATITHDPLPTLPADATQLVQLFQNLIGNAIKFHGDAPPKVHVSARRTDGQWQLSVSDNGIGMEPQYFNRVFVIFQRLHGRDRYPGTGIGLAICKRIVERHGGRIWVESQPGQGSTFFFTLSGETS